MQHGGKLETFHLRGPLLIKEIQKENRSSRTITNMDQYRKTSTIMLKYQAQVLPMLHMYVININWTQSTLLTHMTTSIYVQYQLWNSYYQYTWITQHKIIVRIRTTWGYFWEKNYEKYLENIHPDLDHKFPSPTLRLGIMDVYDNYSETFIDNLEYYHQYRSWILQKH